MQAKALSTDGYIIDQDYLDDIPYGVFPSSYNGCGWVAAFNVMKAAGRELPALQVNREMIAGSARNGRLGTGPRRVCRYMRGKGLPTRATLRRKKALRLAKTARAGSICFYPVGERWPHHVAFTATEEPGIFRFFNVADGAEDLRCSLEDFFKQQARRLPMYMVVTP